ncbi:LacI family DNA-binding transcriptional regulator [Cohnella sp. CFH 77786]|uniref:LacI family DNA-binding transcriptional regulator n=1 Tax=Cohnella sp. CFH 77786 TaxID=2662265 RepID=UPI001C60C1BE|nr:LacI family DNA-binding transcriptional regulator [Cohnella sp. CFH 77786]MBW5445585.1 LacI family DNA-binding transcriptional regulator [Cohnella sp. CFH 77786]
MTTRKEVAELAGVSEATVSRVLNGVGPIKESTRRRVMEAAQRLGYHLNAVASSFARGRSGNLGVVLPHVPKVHLFSTYYFSEILSGIGEAVHGRGYGLLLLFRNPAEPYDYVSLFRTLRIDAGIVLGASSLPSEMAGIRQMSEANLPCCVMDQHFADIRIGTVAADHVEGAYRAVRHLLGRGYRRIGFLNGSPQYSNSADRLAGYRKALKEAGIEPDDSLLYAGNYSWTSGNKAAAAVFADLGRLDALFVANDRMAIGLIQGLRDQGCSLPDDLPIVAYDDSDAARMSEPPLTTVRVPFYEMGKLAAERVLDLAAPSSGGDGAFFEDMLRPELVVRRSCGTPKEV